jgi:ADP-ribosyl-[dinitrogen reductase] hydrolase
MNDDGFAIHSGIIGLAVGDALGVPVEFISRAFLDQKPVTDMIGFGTHHQLQGTWSDDTSLTLCLCDALTEEKCSLEKVGEKFIHWLQFGLWTARGDVFDIGITTRHSIHRLMNGMSPLHSGSFGEHENGNGSLMRILPLLFYIHDKHINFRFDTTRLISGITHGHIRSVVACFYYLEFARYIFLGKDKYWAYQTLKNDLITFLHSFSIDAEELDIFNSLLKDNIFDKTRNEIKSSGYVIHTLEASIWCILTTEDYSDAVLLAVNLGEDTDTTAAVTGGLAGLLYGLESIPAEWRHRLARYNDIFELCTRFKTKY